jgi:tRNA1(Val) A37 N6-methylase TrmN6
MKELVRSNNPVFLSWLQAALEDAGIHTLLLDQHMSIVEGSLGILPRRLLVPDDALDAAKAIMEAGPDQSVVEGIVLDDVATTADSLLGGRVVFYQPAEGYRAAIDPVLLAAALPARAGDHVLDLGAGAGAAALCLARRVAECRVTGLEIDPAMVSIARTNAAENGMSERLAFVAGNVAAPPKELKPESFDAVMLNPPFRAEGSGTPSPDAGKQRANEEAAEADLRLWLATALEMLKPKGTLALIHRADRLDELAALLFGKAGELTILPLWPKAGKPAKRAILRARKGIKTGAALLPGLVLHDADGKYTAAAEAVLRDGAALGLPA